MESFELTGTGGITGLVEVTETVDRESNKSVLQCQLYIKSSRWYGVTYWLRGTALGRSFSSDADSVYLEQKGVYTATGQPWDMIVDHNSDGTGSVLLTVELQGFTAGGGQDSGWKLQGSRTLKLTDIPRASTVSVTNGNIGQTVQISIKRADPTCTHMLQYYFGSLTGQIDPQGETGIAFTLPESFYYEIPDSPTGLCRMVCTTYRAGQQVAEPTEAVFTVTAANCQPVIEAVLQDINEETRKLTKDSSVLVRQLSNVQCTGAAQAQKGAQLMSFTVNDMAVPHVFEGAIAEKYIFRATDSRGYVTELVMEPELIPYTLPVCSGFCSRPDSSGRAELTVQGSWFSGLNNTLKAVATVDQQVYELDVTTAGDSFKATCTLKELSYKRDYDIRVTVTDLWKDCPADVTIQKGKPLFDWSQQDFAFHVPVTAPSINGIKNPPLRAWPIGAVMLTADGVTPAVSVGGRWEQFQLPLEGIYAWKRVQGADTLGSAVLGELILGRED